VCLRDVLHKTEQATQLRVSQCVAMFYSVLQCGAE